MRLVPGGLGSPAKTWNEETKAVHESLNIYTQQSKQESTVTFKEPNGPGGPDGM